MSDKEKEPVAEATSQEIIFWRNDRKPYHRSCFDARLFQLAELAGQFRVAGYYL